MKIYTYMLIKWVGLKNAEVIFEWSLTMVFCNNPLQREIIKKLSGEIACKKNVEPSTNNFLRIRILPFFERIFSIVKKPHWKNLK